MPLFCFQSKSKFVAVGIEFKMPQHKDEVKTFYNIGGEIDWIESALKGKKHNGVMALWKYVKKEKQQSRYNNSSRFSQNLILLLVLIILSCLKMITNRY